MSDTAAMKVLGAIDYKEASTLVVQHSIDLVRRHPAAEAHFLHVSPAAPEDVGAGARRTALLIEWLSQELRALGDVPSHLRIIAHEAHGDPSTVIVYTAHQLSADTLVVGTRERHGVERLMGSVAESVMRHAESPVLVVRPKAFEQPVATIEPACPQCLEARLESRGARLWCDQHAERHGRRHTYYDNRARSWTTQPWFWDGVGGAE
ncbi:MAG TPA: universal stress protein [Polyangiaceae bacterium]|nr:universal stress protein [Polyangiaceae bacterium]